MGKLLTIVTDKENLANTCVDIDLDFNPSKKWLSNMVHDAGVGYFTGYGYRVRCKPNAYAASAAADLVVRKFGRKRRR